MAPPGDLIFMINSIIPFFWSQYFRGSIYSQDTIIPFHLMRIEISHEFRNLFRFNLDED